jgi:hypothetical protein
MTENREALEEAVRSFIQSRFREAVSIKSIDLQDDTDQDGLPILQVRIVFESGSETLPPANEVAGLVRRLRPTLEEFRVEGFPILSFIAAGEHAATT